MSKAEQNLSALQREVAKVLEEMEQPLPFSGEMGDFLKRLAKMVEPQKQMLRRIRDTRPPEELMKLLEEKE